MSKVEKFIQDYTRNCSNEIAHWDIGGENVKPIYSLWLTPDQAREAAKIAREEIYEWLSKNIYMYNGQCENDRIAIIEDLKQAMKNE